MVGVVGSHPFLFLHLCPQIRGFSGVLQDENAGFSVKVTADESQLMILMEDKKKRQRSVGRFDERQDKNPRKGGGYETFGPLVG